MLYRSSFNIRGGVLREYGGQLSAIQQALDIVIALVCLYILVTQVSGTSFSVQYQVLALVTGLFMLVVYQWSRTYYYLRLGGVMQDARTLLKAWAGVLVGLAVLGFVTNTYRLFPREVMLAWAVTGYLAQIGLHVSLRLALRGLRARGFNTRRALLVGAGPLVAEFAHRLSSNPWLGITVAGYVSSPEWNGGPRRRRSDPAPQDHRPGLPLPQRLGDVADAARIVEQEKIELVYLTLPHAHAQVEELVRRLIATNADIHWVPDMTVFQLINHGVREIDGQPVVCLSESPLSGSRRAVKWAEDKILATVALLVMALPMLAIAAAIRLTSPGPVLFRQQRQGLNGAPFEIWKFRTMKLHSERDGTLTQATADDPRVTRLGALLRRTSLDELPQLVNVLQGRMSLVGPRPHAVEHDRYYGEQIDAYLLRYKILPGITGWAQVNGYRGPTEERGKMEDRLRYDLWYIDNWSLWLDLKIMLMTFKSVLTGKNAI